MLTCMRVRRQVWAQLRKTGQRSIGAPSNRSIYSPLSSGRIARTPVFGDGAGLGLGFRVGQQKQNGYASEAGTPSPPPQPVPNGLGKGLEPIGGLPEPSESGRRFAVRNGVWLMAGAGTIALLGVVAVSTDVFHAAPDAKARVESGFSAVWSSGAGIGRELMKMAGSVKDASVRSFVDFVEAVAAIWVLARCIASILESAVDNTSSEVASWWRPRVASFLAGTASL